MGILDVEFISLAVAAVLWGLVAAIFKYIERKKEWGERLIMIGSLFLLFASAWSLLVAYGNADWANSLVTIGAILGFIFCFIGSLVAIYEEFA